jgi:hypothetical protein
MATTNCSEFQLGEIAGEAGQCSIVGDGESTLIVPIAASSVHNIEKQWTTSFVLGGCMFSRQVWSAVLRKLHLVVSLREEKIFSWWLRERRGKRCLPKVFR